MAGITPMMEQYFGIKERYKYCLLFYRLGDFYELFYDDARIASRELDLVLTSRACGNGEKAPMCGVQFSHADKYIAKLIDKGYKVAICEQTEDPRKAKGLVKRDVIRVITPGTVLDSSILDEDKHNYIMSLFQNVDGYGVASCDVSTGDMQVIGIDIKEPNRVIDEIARLMPSEIIANEGFELKEQVENVFDKSVGSYEERAFSYQNANICLCNHFATLNLAGFGIEGDRPCVCAGGALMSYLMDTQKNSLSHISNIRRYSYGKYMSLDISSRRNLELTETIRDKSKRGSLLWVLDRTKTAMGARYLRGMVERPLTDVAEINKRLECVESFKNNPISRGELRDALDNIYDIERIIGRVVYGNANARDLIALKSSLERVPDVKRLVSEYFSGELCERLCGDIDTLEDVCSWIDESITPEPPFTLREGGIIKAGYNEELDRLRGAKSEGAKWLLELESREKELTGIPKLRVKYDNTLGYYLEVTNSMLDKVPQDRYIFLKTLKSSVRYTTAELKELSESIVGSDDKAAALEYELFTAVRNRVSGEFDRIKSTANALAAVDAMQSLGEVAEKNSYSKPVVDENYILEIKGGRHPVVEQVSKEQFIPNDTYMDMGSYVDIITGPNMAGKSTYMRQCALIVLMAQIGSFVPAESSHIGVVDRIFTRVGASDDLATGQSTFMVEMSEVANILNNAGANSLLVLDEIGRGTATFDGLSIAWAVIEYIAEKIGARTLFATHYHELTELEGKVDGVSNYCVSVKEQDGKVIFLRKIVRGSNKSSYGVYVARLAGVPAEVADRADSILSVFNEDKGAKDIVKAEGDEEEDFLYDFTPCTPEKIFIDELTLDFDSLDIDNMTPFEAMKKLYDVKSKIEDIKK
jgi:DNA mismatch repair protein MutS